MQCLIVRQPYASLIAFGKKRWEFRSYEVESRKLGIIGIASSPNDPLRTWDRGLNNIVHSFPKGVVLATAELVTSFYVTGEELKECLTSPVDVNLHGKIVKTLGEPLGEPLEDVKLAISKKNWESYAWQLDNVKPLEHFLPIETTSKSTWVDVDISGSSISGSG